MTDDDWLYAWDAIQAEGGDPDDPREHAAMQRVRDQLRALGRAHGIPDRE